MGLTGEEAKGLTITSVTCYQSGSGKTKALDAECELTLLLKDGKTGENRFDVRAEDADGTVYSFTVNIPYKPRGDQEIKITTNLADGQTITNDTEVARTVQAWTEDENGNFIAYVPADGTDTKLTVTFDGAEVSPSSPGGKMPVEYFLHPANPELGDTNEHELIIEAEDAYGNRGREELTFIGQRQEAGQKIGKATIYVDMSVLGLGVVANVSYDVLADEPVSHVIAKAIMGDETKFRKASSTLGWKGRYAGTLDNGFYLQSLTTGHTAKALKGGTWPGSNETEILKATDKRFGAGTGLAALWRCLYRNGLNKSSGSGNSFGEFDYTSGSGWMYSIGGTYYPGQSMSSLYLKDGDVLILRYTLAYGWDVGGGTPAYGNTVGYCVSAINGHIDPKHRWETVTNADGSVSNMCRCCGIVEDCAHGDTIYMDLGDGTHIEYCNDCKKELGDPADHGWTHKGSEADDYHRCETCGVTENHRWKEVDGSNTATCTEAGTRSVRCSVCNLIRTEETAPSGHALDNKWQVTAKEHYEKCSACGEITNQGSHQYKLVTYTENGGRYMNPKLNQILQEIEKVVVGKNEIVEKIMMAVLADGHVLMEDVPGTGKTTTAMAFAKVLGLDTRRVQFTSDTVPSDIIGYSVYEKQSGSFVFKPGAVMTNLLLADEINRTSSKTQSALLEAMEEMRVTVDGQTYPLPDPFVVLATQNPVGSAGTQMLPSAQMDRFIIKISMGYPDFESQISILRDRHRENPLDKIHAVVRADELRQLIRKATEVEVQDCIYEYVTKLTQATREHPMVQLGVSPRGALAVCRMAKAYAYLHGRDFVVPEDVAAVFTDTCCHRLVLATKARMMEERPEGIIRSILGSVKMPVIKR